MVILKYLAEPLLQDYDYLYSTIWKKDVIIHNLLLV